MKEINTKKMAGKPVTAKGKLFVRVRALRRRTKTTDLLLHDLLQRHIDRSLVDDGDMASIVCYARTRFNQLQQEVDPSGRGYGFQSVIDVDDDCDLRFCPTLANTDEEIGLSLDFYIVSNKPIDIPDEFKLTKGEEGKL